MLSRYSYQKRYPRPAASFWNHGVHGFWYGQVSESGLAPNGPLVDGELAAQDDRFDLERYLRADGHGKPANEKEQKGAQGSFVKGAWPPIMPA